MAELIFVITLALVAQTSALDWAKADRETARLSPSAFTSLPAAIRGELERRGCTVPQPFNARRPGNVVSGRFTSATAADWAALCSIKQASSILVFRGGSTSSVDVLATHPDLNYLQVVGPNQAIGYSRAIGVATAASIRQHNRNDPKIPSPDHDGITDAFVEKGSTVWYWSSGHWLELSGTD
ncbi:MAG: hypothetical protein LAO77_08335 [Acidobacteriia bacterium]|nr:hypothetical protein [Terriglobia bacterium]